MRESQQLLSQQNFNSEQQKSVGGKGKEKEKAKSEPEVEIGAKNGLDGHGVRGTNGASNDASGAKVKEGRRGSIKKKWAAYRKKAD